MKYYVVGISSRAGRTFSSRVYGDALVFASDKYTALSNVREAGWVPNPGDVFLLGTEEQKSIQDHLDPEEVELLKAKAREERVAVIWTSLE